MPLLVLDDVVVLFETELAAHPPERGGALLGPRATNAISQFVFDEDAQTTSVTYQPSRALAALVRELEATDPLRYRGISHSHPAGFDRPSPPDVREAAKGLELNPHIASYHLSIITRRPPESLDGHECALPSGKASFYAVARSRDGHGELYRTPVVIHPAGEMVREAAALLELRDCSGLRDIEVDGAALLSAAGHDPVGRDWSLLLGWSPLTPALVLCDGHLVPVRWDPTVPAAERLEHALRGWQSARRSSRQPLARRAAAVGHGIGSAIAAIPSAQSRSRVRDLHARTDSILPIQHAVTRHVLIIGCGSVGSTVSSQLGRNGISQTLVDPDRVSAANLSRTEYGIKDIGKFKVRVQARRLRAANPNLSITTRARKLTGWVPAWLEREAARGDLIVAATDDPQAQLLLDALAHRLNIPIVFIGVTASGHGGEVLLVVPGQTTCYGCALAIRQQQPPEMRGSMDYGSGRLNAEPALGCDIAMVSSAASHICLSVLAPEDSQLAAFADEIVAAGHTYLTIGTTPGYWCYPAIFDGVPGQFAFQSVWMNPTSRPDCPRCGENHGGEPGMTEHPEIRDLRRLATPTANPAPTVLKEDVR